MRCIIGFFGLTRSLRHTAASIHHAFYKPLRHAGVPILTAGHFNLPDIIDNPRSGECAVVPDRSESGLLPLDLSWIERQCDTNVADEFEVAAAFADSFGDGYRSLANLCQQLRSLDQMWRLMGLLGEAPDDVFLLLRPDLLYLDQLEWDADVGPIVAGHVDLIVPDWQRWGGLNDRFAFCNRRGARVYATRIRAWVDGCLALNGMHSERFLRFIAERDALRVAHTSLRAVRVRSNGTFAKNDASLLKPAPTETRQAC